jgi:hypothetical protein
MLGGTAFDADLLGVYRNTSRSTLTGALALSFPAVRALVGAEFFEAVAAQFIAEQPPTSAYLNDFGQAFPAFLAQQPQARELRYLPDVAHLEWAVNRGLHASDVAPLDLGALAALDPALAAEVCLLPHPAVTVLETCTPADLIWRAVLGGDDAALEAIDLACEPLWLLVERTGSGVQVRRMTGAAAHFTQRLCAGESLQSALNAGGAPEAGLEAVLADHLAQGRFIGWRLLTGGVV